MVDPAGARRRALELLAACATGDGFVAAARAVRNYRRVWSRDGVICGLAALAAGEPALIDAFEATLRTLAGHPGRSGQLPSNVAPETQVVSYGHKAGRADATLWFIVGIGTLGRLGGRDAVADELWPVVVRALDVVRAWELNDRHLIYVARAGDWADEYDLHGYVLYDQALRLWAWREAAAAARRLGREEAAAGLEAEAAAVTRRLITDYWPTAEGRAALYDRVVLEPLIRADRRHFLAAFEPGGAQDRFDALGNALCCMLGAGSDQQRAMVCDHASGLVRHGLVPAFDPVIQPEEPEYAILEAASAGEVRERPGRYHNGGLWPMVNGFWVLAARACGAQELADRLATGIVEAVALDNWRFAEYLDASTGEPAGVQQQAWSAAAVLLACSTPTSLVAPAQDAADGPPGVLPS